MTWWSSLYTKALRNFWPILQINTVILKQQTSEGRSQLSIIEMISSWSRCSTRFNFGPSTLRFYIDDLPQGLRCNKKLFSDGSSFFLTITKPEISSWNLNEDLRKIVQCNYQWKRKGQEIVYLSKKKSHPSYQVNSLIMHEYNENLFKNILVFFR